MTMVKLYLYIGVLLLSCSAAIHYFLYLRLRDAGRNYIVFDCFWPVLSDYLRLRSKNGWSAWPPYLAVLAMVVGLVVFCIGAFKL
jgi:hypothetical protein